MIAARLYRFNAVHSLPDFPEPWCRVHGHRYTIELTGEFNHEEADALWENIKDRYEYTDLNERVPVTTVEGLARHFAAGFRAEIKGIDRVKVWEDDDRWGLWSA